MALNMGKLITLTKDTDTLEGILTKIYTSPEMLRNRLMNEDGVFPVVQSAGYRTIDIKVVVSVANENSSILLDPTGITFYTIEGEEYLIQAVKMEGDNKSRTALITLISNQQDVVDPVDPSVPSETITGVLHKDTDPANDYTLTGIIAGSNLVLEQTGQTGFYKLIIAVYKYSADDAYLSNNIYNWFEKGITITQEYEQGGVTKSEVFSSDRVVELHSYLPDVTINDKGVPAGIMEYTLIGNIQRTLET